MKRKILGLILSFLLLFFIGGCQEAITIGTEAEILSINSHILNGELISNFLSGSSGSITNDMIKIGIKLEIGKYLFLEDLEFRHAELAYYKNSNELHLDVKCCAGIGWLESGNYLKIYLNGVCKRHINLSSEVADNILNILKILQESNAG